MSDLPKYFVTESGSTYKLFLNTVYQTRSNINILWPIVNLRVNNLTARLCDNSATFRSSTRTWNGTEYTSCDWSYTGSSVELYLIDSEIYVIAPIIHMSNMDCLPFNPSKFSPRDAVFIDEVDMTAYMAAKIYRTDPALSENTTPVRSYVPVASPVAMAMASTMASPMVMASPMASPMASTMASPKPKPKLIKSLPSHITKIVLADAISKNEICPITSETITASNATVTACGHVFCSSAIDKWLASPSSKGLCPTCRSLCI